MIRFCEIKFNLLCAQNNELLSLLCENGLTNDFNEKLSEHKIIMKKIEFLIDQRRNRKPKEKFCKLFYLLIKCVRNLQCDGLMHNKMRTLNDKCNITGNY